jgi:hypothetical protein
MIDKINSPDGVNLEEEKVMWYPPFNLKDKMNRQSITFDLEILSADFGSQVKRVIIQKVPKENNKLRVGLVINVPSLLLEEPVDAKQKQPETRGSGSL